MFKKSLIALTIGTMFSPVYSQTVEQTMNVNAYSLVGVQAAWARGFTGRGQIIGILDTGVDLKNKDLGSNVVSASGLYSGIYADDIRGHGTYMASIAAGAKNNVGIVGVAYDANIISYKAGIGQNIYENGVQKGLIYLADRSAGVINMSFGTSIESYNFKNYYIDLGNGVYKSKFGNDAYRTMNTTLPYMAYATQKGSILVIAAGNDGNPVPSSPANFVTLTGGDGKLILGGRALVVGAVNDLGQIAPWSNKAGSICNQMVNGVCKDTYKISDFYILAPGASISASQSGSIQAVDRVSGTSPATAVVSGGVALLKQAWPTLKPEQIVQLLTTTANKNIPGYDPKIYGQGIMDLNKATMPQGTLALSSKTGLAQSSTQLTTGMATGALGALTKSSIMNNAQFVDNYGRNYALDMSKVMVNNLTNFNQNFTYMGLSTAQANYGGFKVGSVSYEFSQSYDGFATRQKLDTKFGWVGVEAGTVRESNGVLGSQGAGAFNPGTASTSFYGVSAGYNLQDQTELYGGMSFGRTNAKASTDGLISGYSNIQTMSYHMGYKTSLNFVNKDTLDFKFTVLPFVTNGHATVSATTGYTYTEDTAGNTTATPINNIDNVSLRTSYRQMATTMSYSAPLRLFAKDDRAIISFSTLFDNQGSKSVTPMAYVGYQARF